MKILLKWEHYIGIPLSLEPSKKMVESSHTVLDLLVVSKSVKTLQDKIWFIKKSMLMTKVLVSTILFKMFKTSISIVKVLKK